MIRVMRIIMMMMMRMLRWVRRESKKEAHGENERHRSLREKKTTLPTNPLMRNVIIVVVAPCQRGPGQMVPMCQWIVSSCLGRASPVFEVRVSQQVRTFLYSSNCSHLCRRLVATCSQVVAVRRSAQELQQT